MKAYQCRVCGNALYFENSVCVSCGTGIGYARGERALVPVDAAGVYVDADGWIWHVCRNLNLSGCTWLAPLEGGQCFSCDLTRTRPADTDGAGLASFLLAERAKRHLIAELDALGFPVVGRSEDAVNGLAFDLLSSELQKVLIAHSDGVVTIDLAEGDDSHRERIRSQLAEPYRTVLGHFRHEIGHYYQWQLIERGDDDALRERCREVFGDEQADYQSAVTRYYADGPPPLWSQTYISSYASMHPYEDFAETWAHYLHISDTIETAVEYGLTSPAALAGHPRFHDLLTEVWIPLSAALNLINRSMGKVDL